MKATTTYIIFTLNIILASCTGGLVPSNQKKAADASVPETLKPGKTLSHLSSPSQHFVIQSTQPNRIETPEGSEILIAAGSFEFEDGTPVVGKVDIEYYSYKNPLDIIAAGIPMQVKYKGTIENFISDGMFNINATADGKPVKIVSNKSLYVFTPLSDKANDYKYWFLEPIKQEWKEIGIRDKPATKDDKAKAADAMGIPQGVACISVFGTRIRSIVTEGLFKTAAVQELHESIIIPNKIFPAAYDPKRITLDLAFNKKEYPELAEYRTVMWQYCGNNPAQDPQNQSWLFQEKWLDIKLKSIPGTANTFQLSFTTTRGVFNTVVRPVVSGQDLEKAKALYDKWLKVDSKSIALEKLQKEGASAQTIEKQMYNAFRVNQLGTYNCDRFYNDPFAQNISLTMLLNNAPIESSIVYLLTDNNKNFITVSSDNPTVKINRRIVDGAVCVAGTGAIAIADAISVAGFKNSIQSEGQLKFSKVSHKIFNMQTLLEALGMK